MRHHRKSMFVVIMIVFVIASLLSGCTRERPQPGSMAEAWYQDGVSGVIDHVAKDKLSQGDEITSYDIQPGDSLGSSTLVTINGESCTITLPFNSIQKALPQTRDFQISVFQSKNIGDFCKDAENAFRQ